MLFLLLSCCTLSFAQTDFTPSWSKGVVWYQIFPDRFYNGDPSNDPKVNDQEGAYPFDTTSDFKIHPWTSDWYQLQEYEKSNGKDIYYNLQRRRYGGDLQGVIDKLDYLQSLGINAIYMNPIFWAPSSHKYDALCYHHVDPTLGPDPEGDKKMILNEDPLNPEKWVWTKADLLALKLIDEVHKRKMFIIFDGVFNHLGANSFAFKDVAQNQEKSAFKDWFMVDSWKDVATGTEFKYQGWFGVKTLPEFKEDANGLVEGPKKYIFDATKRWMNPMNKGKEFGIDGWRLDVAYCIAHPFWKDWRKVVKSINSEAYLTAELVDPIDKTVPYLSGDEFDATMNYNFSFIVHDFFVQDSAASSVTNFDNQLKELRNAFGKGVAYNMQNLVGSHDATRIGSAVANPDGKKFSDWGPYFNWSQKSNNKQYNARKPNTIQIEKQKLIAAFQLLYLGSPMIYYGDEVGMWGSNDPDCRKPMLWQEMKYQDEVMNPDQSQHDVDHVLVNFDLLEWYKKFIQLRNKYESIRTGDYKTLEINDEQKLYVFSRTKGTEEVLVFINRGSKSQTVNNAKLQSGSFTDVFTRKRLKKVVLSPLSIVVVTNQLQR
ncbi:alpha-amylase [Flavobacterium sp. F339]|uniref:Glycoside hydrolase family 13 protein n=2 Tax=Flavobacterium turcicum TaxID=2764718 RepID=A0ABR7JFQ6_9FLAO|nr:glycoside hydrolase family 13 protein [Flavobacterium turcicum]NHL02019.1 alpha-amylase [Flavobacterium turcicum]